MSMPMKMHNAMADSCRRLYIGIGTCSPIGLGLPFGARIPTKLSIATVELYIYITSIKSN